MSNPVARDPRQQLERHLKSHRTFRNVDHQLKWLKVLYEKLNPDLAADNTNNSPVDQSIGSASGHHQVSYYLRQMKAALRTQHGDYRPKPGTTSVLLLFDDSPKVPPQVSFIFVKYPKNPQDGLPTIIDDTTNQDVALYSAAIYQKIWEAFEEEESVDVEGGVTNITQAATGNTNWAVNEEEFLRGSIKEEVENELVEIFDDEDNGAEQDQAEEEAIAQNNGQATEGITYWNQQQEMQADHQQNQQHQPNNSAQSGLHLATQTTSHSFSLPADVEKIKQESYDGLNCWPSHSEPQGDTPAMTDQPSSSSSAAQQNNAGLGRTATRISLELRQQQQQATGPIATSFDPSSEQLPLLKDDPASAEGERTVIRIFVKSPAAQRHASTSSQTRGASTSATSTSALATSSRVQRHSTGSSPVATGGEAIAEGGRKRSLADPADLAFDQSRQALPSSVKRSLSVLSSSAEKHSHHRRQGSSTSSSNQAAGPSSLSTALLRPTQTPNSVSSTSNTQSNPVQSQQTAATVELVKGYLKSPLYKRATSNVKLPCPICQKPTYQPLMYDHLNTAHLGKKGQHVCTYPSCVFTTTIFFTMISHLQSVHKLAGNDQEVEQFVDQYGEARAAAAAAAAEAAAAPTAAAASTTLSAESYLVQHCPDYLRTTNNYEKLACPVCSKKIAKYRLREHFNGVHLRKKPFHCAWKDCTWASSWRDGVKKHLKEKHRSSEYDRYIVDTEEEDGE